MAPLFVKFSLLLFYFNVVEPYLNLEELNKNQYSFHLSSDPVLKRNEENLSIMYMKSKYGQLYECNIPEVTTNEGISQKEALLDDRPIPELLEPMKSSGCLVKVKDWWTYKFCYGQDIKQYHYDENEGIVGPILSLGTFSSDFNWDNITDDSPNKRRRYHSQYYVNGTKCDLNGNLRHTEIRFICNKDTKQHFSQIDEPSSCQYIIEIQTSLICNHVYTKPAFKIISKQITCSPVLQADEFESYKQTEELKKIKAEEKKRQWLIKEKAKLNDLKKNIEKSSDGSSDIISNGNSDKDKKDFLSKDKLIDDQPKNSDDKIDSRESLDNGKESEGLQIERNNQYSDDAILENGNEDNVDEQIRFLTDYLRDQIIGLKKRMKNSEEPVVKKPSGAEEKDEDNIEQSTSPDNEDQNSFEVPTTEADQEKEKIEAKGDLNRNTEQKIIAKSSGSTDKPENDEISASTKDESNSNLINTINNKLAEAGMNGGQNVQIKIIRVTDDHEIEEWSDQTHNSANTAQKTIIAYVRGGMSDSLKQIMQQQEQEKIYKFTYKKKKESDNEENNS